MYDSPAISHSPDATRRSFLRNTLAVAAAVPALGVLGATSAEPAKPKQKIKLGLVGCGGRGMWLTKLFDQHGGYVFHAVADYFEDVAQKAGEKLGVDKSRRYSGLSGYKRLLESGVEAVAIEDVPYFYAEQAKAAVEAGLHVYMAKPIAVDVPGCLAIGAAGKAATEKRRVMLIDYQLPTDPAVIEVAKRVRSGGLGSLAHVVSFGFAWHTWPDPPLGKTIESRLRDEIWLSDTALSGDTIVSYDIHIIDTLVWLLGKRPVRACGFSRTCRPTPHGDRTDALAVTYECDDGLIWNHVTQALDNNPDLTTLSAGIFGTKATAHLQYGGKVYVRGGSEHYVGSVGGIYDEGARRNVAEFHRAITEGHFENLTVPRAVDGTLTAILGREAAAGRRLLTMDELLKENKALPVDLSGLKS